ncbi:MAG: hypothetical protein IPL35_13780 [Sphingobacteriales bacterium]|nr:hypothetical protein [Sphingobacteriales bacterium]
MIKTDNNTPTRIIRTPTAVLQKTTDDGLECSTKVQCRRRPKKKRLNF